MKVFRHGRLRTVEETRSMLALAGFARFRRLPVAGMGGVVAVLVAAL